LIRALASLIFALTLVSGARAEIVTSLADGRAGVIVFDSFSPATIGEIIDGSFKYKTTTIHATLALPANATTPMPAMVIAHGSGGLGFREREWARRLNEWGIATFLVDSFTLRGISSTAEDQSQLSQGASAIDAFLALKLLATHPAIDAERIGVIGFSKGGGVAMHTAFDKLRRSVIDGKLKFAAHVPFYPGCGLAFHSRELTRTPILHLHGQADDWTPVAPCLAWMEWLRSQGVPIESRIYAGAYHGFDGGGPPRYLPRVQSFKKCDEILDLDSWRRTDRQTGELSPRYASFQAVVDRCVVRGAHIGVDPEAQRQAIVEVRGFLARVFKIEIR